MNELRDIANFLAFATVAVALGSFLWLMWEWWEWRPASIVLVSTCALLAFFAAGASS